MLEKVDKQQKKFFFQFLGIFNFLKKAKKVKLEKRIPEWSSGHPDFKYFCAYNPNSTEEFYRFEQFVPPGWEQVFFFYFPSKKKERKKCLNIL